MKPKRLPRLWCALHGLLPLEACLAAQRGELAWPHEDEPEYGSAAKPTTPSAAAGSKRRGSRTPRPAYFLTGEAAAGAAARSLP
jgi:hypothetical protein